MKDKFVPTIEFVKNYLCSVCHSWSTHDKEQPKLTYEVCTLFSRYCILVLLPVYLQILFNWLFFSRVTPRLCLPECQVFQEFSYVEVGLYSWMHLRQCQNTEGCFSYILIYMYYYST